jgi:predicted MFS family arabinose efflux permease
MTAPAPAIATASDPLLRWGTIIAAGMFASNLAMPDVLDLPIRNLLRTELKLGRDEVSLFMSLAGLPWYLKILAGLLSDCFPLLGTRRRHYLVFSGALAAVCWLLVGAVPHNYWPLLFALMATHLMLVFVSTVTGGLIVEAGKRFGTESQLVTVRVIVESACSVIAGPIAGFLASQAFGWTGVAGALIVLTVVPAALFLLREPPDARYDAALLRETAMKLRQALGSRALWLTALFLALANAPQTFATTLNFHQAEQLGLASIDIGYLGSISALAGVATAAVYGTVRARFTLRTLLVIGILCGAVMAATLLFYRSWESAVAVEILHGALGTVGVLALMEAAVRATPASIAAMGFALLMSAWNIGLSVGDYAGAWLVERGYLSFYGLAGLFAVLSALTVFALPLLPRSVLTESPASVVDDPKNGL